MIKEVQDAPPLPARMDIDLEVHIPGLDLNSQRWNYHVIFMGEVHRHIGHLRDRARREYHARGRGAFFVSARQWLQIVKQQFEHEDEDVPLDYLPAAALLAHVDFGPLQEGIGNLLRDYDPERRFLLVVQHHPGDLLSCYLVNAEAVGQEIREAR